MRIFLRAGVPEFVSRYPEMCPKFTMMINSIVDMYRAQIAEEKFVFYFGENHEQDFREIVRHFPEECYIFVYGTLMKGQRNYAHYLAPAEPCATAVLNGYRMFDIGSFPGIVRGRGDVKGEVYRVNAQQLAAIDRLEGEGDLYIKTPVNVMVTDDSCLRANVYVYNRKVKGLPEIPFDRQPYGKSDKVWYVAYGSNLLEERLEYYIKGGTSPLYQPHDSKMIMPVFSISVLSLIPSEKGAEFHRRRAEAGRDTVLFGWRHKVFLQSFSGSPFYAQKSSGFTVKIPESLS